MSDILLKIYNTIGTNWQRLGNLRYAVTYKPQGDGMDKAFAKERANQMARAWKDAMSSTETVKDFVAVGDVKVSVIGADNQILDSEIPVRQMLEQIIAKTGLKWTDINLQDEIQMAQARLYNAQADNILKEEK